MKRILLDANLLVLLVVGLAGRSLIQHHRHLRAYTAEEFDLLVSSIENFDALLVIPNIMTECSNLARKIDGPAHRVIGEKIADLASTATEIYIQTLEAAKSEAYLRLGVSDAALLTLLIDPSVTLYTADLDLFLQASAIAPDRVLNWNHLKDTL